MRTPKQLLKSPGSETMLRETAARLEPMIPSRNMWVVTNVEQAAAVRREMRGMPASHILAEPVGRNTAAAIGLAAMHLAHEHGDALMAVLPSDSYIADAERYRRLVRAALELARTPGNLVVLGVPPTRPETGYGYIESARIRRGRAASPPTRCGASPKSRRCRRAKICGFREIFLERGDVFLARLDVSRKLAALPPADARGAARTGQNHRHAALRFGAAPHLSAARKYFRGLRDHGAGHSARQRAAASP